MSNHNHSVSLLSHCTLQTVDQDANIQSSHL